MTSNPYLNQIAAVVRNLAFSSGSHFTWAGHPALPLPTSLQRVLSPDDQREALILGLRDTLYRGFFCQGGSVGSGRGMSVPAATAPRAFAHELSRANSGGGFWQAGWSLERSTTGPIVRNGDGLVLRVGQDDVKPDDRSAASGAVCLRAPKGSFAMCPGYYTAFGDYDLEHEGRDVIRIYMNVTPLGAVSLTRQVTAKLNQRLIPFRLAIAANEAEFWRSDAVVLYMDRSDFEAVREVLTPLVYEPTFGLRPAVPALTKRLASGVGLAEDPPDGNSFGMQRCHLVSAALVRAYQDGKTTVEDRVAAVSEHLEVHGVDLERPYLNPGSRDIYQRLETDDDASCAN